MDQRLTIDLRMYRHSGIGRYLQSLLPLVLPLIEAAAIRVVARRSLLEGATWVSDSRVEVLEDRSPIYSVSEQMMAMRGAFDDSELLWVPHYNAPLWSHCRTVLTIHDIAPIAIPAILDSAVKRRYASVLIRRAVSQAAAVLTVSEFTASELRNRLGVAREKITVAPPGLDASWIEASPAHREEDGLPYLLFVGNVKPNKNLGLLLEAFSRVMGSLPHRLVLAGKVRGLGTDDGPAVRRAAALGDRVRLAGEVSEEMLRSLYAGASALCLPSLYEGFGFPLLEAMAKGCPVLCSTAGSLPEVADGAALYFDPHDAASLARCLMRVTEERAMDELRCAGRLRVREFRFDRCAEITASVLNRAMRGIDGSQGTFSGS